MRKLILAIILVSTTLVFARAQVPAKSEKEMTAANNFIRLLANKLNFNRFKDSTAIYTCKVQIIVDRKRPSNLVLSTNDSTVIKNIKGLDSLKAIDFYPLMGKHTHVAFQLPIAVVVFSSNQENQTIDLNIVSDKILMLHYNNKLETGGVPVIHLFPHIVTLDKKVYD